MVIEDNGYSLIVSFLPARRISAGVTPTARVKARIKYDVLLKPQANAVSVTPAPPPSIIRLLLILTLLI